MNVYPFILFFFSNFQKSEIKLTSVVSRMFSLRSLSKFEFNFLFSSCLRSLQESLPRVYSANREKKNFERHGTELTWECSLSSRALLSQVNHHPAAAWSATLSAIVPLQGDTAGARRLRGNSAWWKRSNARKRKNFFERGKHVALCRCRRYNHFPKNCGVNRQFYEGKCDSQIFQR